MKSIEDLNLMGVPALQGIHLQMTGNKPKANMSKQQLVMRVFELQQPDPVAPKAPERVEGATEGASNQPAKAESLAADDLSVDDDAPAADPTDPNSADFLSVSDEEPGNDDLIGDAPAPVGLQLPAQEHFAVSDAQAVHGEVHRALAHLPVQVAVDQDVVTIRKGGREICTTMKQPLHRIVSAAESFARK